MSRARALLALLGVLAISLSPAVALAGTGANGGPRPSEVDAALAFRQKLGLRADRAFVGGTFSRPGFSSATWGVPLDAAESVDLDRRAGLQRALGRAVRAWARADAFAGAYVDQRAGGTVVLLTTGDPAGARRAIGHLLPDGAAARIRIERTRHSMAELLVLQERVNGDLRSGVLADLGVVSTSIDARSNAVVVGVTVATDEISAALAARFGAAIRVEAEAPAQGGDAGCQSREDCAPAKGGIEIVSAYNSNNMCTIGFLVRVAGSSHPRILTAGHCVGLSGGTGTSRDWAHDGVNVGWPELSSWADGADADVALLSPASGAIEGDRNLVYRASASDIAPITDWASNAEQIQGGLICRAGIASNYHCGTIELTNRTRAVDGRTIDHQWVVDFDACPGDSGGPYLLGNVAYGIHTDSSFGCDPSTNQAWYSPIGWALDVLEAQGHPVELCTTPTCGADTNVWTARGALADAPFDARLVALPDGRALKAGGLGADPVGPPAAGGVELAPEIFDPVLGTWSDAATPPWAPARCEGQFVVGLQDGRVLVGGGRRADAGEASACSGAHVFDPDSGPEGSWETVESPPAALVSAAAVLLDDGRAFVVGGSGTDGSTPVTLAYAPAADDWQTLAAAPAGSMSPLALRLADGRVLVSGGYVGAGEGGGFEHVTATHLYDPDTNDWDATTAVGAYGAGGTVLSNGRVIVAGGKRLSWDGTQATSFVTTVSRFDPSTDAWTSLPALPTARANFTLAELPNGLILAGGGRVPGSGAGGDLSKSTVAYEPVAKVWYGAPAMNTARAGQGSLLLDDGTLLVAGGGTASAESYVAGDVIPPSGSAPSMALRSKARMSGSSALIRVSWSAATDAGGSGAGSYEIARSTDGGAFSTIASQVVGTTYDTTVAPGHTYRFRVRPRDWAGNVGAWKAGTTLSIAATQQTSSAIAYTGSWTTGTSSSFYGGTVRYSKSKGAKASYVFTGRGVSFVTTRGPARGSAKIYVDGVLVTTVSLYRATTEYRYVAYHKSWSSSGQHRISVVVSGTSGRPRVDIDAFIVLRNP